MDRTCLSSWLSNGTRNSAVAALKLGAADYVVKARDPLRALGFKLDRMRASSALLQEQANRPCGGDRQ